MYFRIEGFDSNLVKIVQFALRYSTSCCLSKITVIQILATFK